MAEATDANDVSAGDLFDGGDNATKTPEYEDVVSEVEDDKETPEDTGGTDDTEQEIEEEPVDTPEEPEEVVDEPPVDSNRLKELKTKYPNLLKEFPEVKARWYQAEAYAEIFPTPEEAQEAAGNIEIMDGVLGNIEKGNSIPLLQAIMERSGQSAQAFGENLLSCISHVSPDLFRVVTLPYVSKLINSIAQAGKAQGNEILVKTAKNVSLFLFGQGEPPTKRPEDPEITRKRQELDARDKANKEEDENKFVFSVKGNIETSLKNEVLKTIDPKNAMTPRVRELATQQVLLKLDEQLSKSPTHMGKMRSFRKEGARTGYTDDLKRRMILSYRKSAAPLLPGIRAQVRAEITGSGQLEKPNKPGKHIPGTPAGARRDNRVPDASKVDWNKTSDKDFLAGKITLKENRR